MRLLAALISNTAGSICRLPAQKIKDIDDLKCWDVANWGRGALQQAPPPSPVAVPPPATPSPFTADTGRVKVKFPEPSDGELARTKRRLGNIKARAKASLKVLI